MCKKDSQKQYRENIKNKNIKIIEKNIEKI